MYVMFHVAPQTNNEFSLYKMNTFLCVAEAGRIYCAARNDSLNKTDHVLPFKGLMNTMLRPEISIFFTQWLT